MTLPTMNMLDALAACIQDPEAACRPVGLPGGHRFVKGDYVEWYSAGPHGWRPILGGGWVDWEIDPSLIVQRDGQCVPWEVVPVSQIDAENAAFLRQQDRDTAARLAGPPGDTTA